MMFNKYNNYKQHSSVTINIDVLVQLIKDNPAKAIIANLREAEYKSKEYNNLKEKLICVTLHGIFGDSKKDSVKSLSGYLYFDIDGFDSQNELESTIKKLNDEYPLTFICKSCGGRGLAFIIKVPGITTDNFETTHAFIRNEFLKNNYNIDKAAGGLIRKWIVSHDPNVIYNEAAEYVIDNEAYDLFVKENTTPIIKKASNLKPDDTIEEEHDVIPFSDLCKIIKTESEYSGEIIGDYVIDEMPYYKIVYPRVIPDGKKHSTFIRIINALYFLNREITHHQVFSYIYHVNSLANPKMDIWKLKNLVSNICNSIEKTSDIRIKTRTKKIHFNPNTDLSKREKQSMGASINAVIRTNKTIESIVEMKQNLLNQGVTPTQKLVAKELGISLSTIKRNWNCETKEVAGLDPKLKKKSLDNLSEFDYVEDYEIVTNAVDNNDFFNDWEI